jgi:integrase
LEVVTSASPGEISLPCKAADLSFEGGCTWRDAPASQPRFISERLSHATVSITLDTYSHAVPAMQEEAAALIAGLVFAGE